MIELAKTLEVTELVLVQDEHDRTLFSVPGVGTIRAGGYFGGGGATITVGDATWECGEQGRLIKRYVATDRTGATLATFAGSNAKPGRGTIRWNGRRLGFKSTERGVRALSERGVVHAELTGQADGACPVRGRLFTNGLPPELLLFAFSIALARQRHATRRGAGATAGGGAASSVGCSGGDGGGSIGCSGGNSGCGGGSGGGGCGGGGCSGGS